jgi:hypothetical protein
MSTIQVKNNLNGGEFLIKETDPMNVFIPEEWNEEQRMIAESCLEFLKTEVAPKFDDLDSMKYPELMPELLRKSADMGLMGAGVPEEYGGMGFDFLTQMLITENLGPGHSFSVGISAHTGIGTLPTLYFGTAEQKAEFLPKLASGEWLASYCLTEPGSGSDALGAKSTAILSDDGSHYVLNGQKIWITNGGFADLFTVFAQVDGKQFTGFLIPADSEGVTRGVEEKKMGIKGSSTRAIFFQNVKVPTNMVLGEIGKGHKIAFNILNIGRIKLAGAAVGGCKQLCSASIKYAAERHQFGQPIASFGAIQYKLAQQALLTWVLESATYRATSDIQDKEHQLLAEGKSYAEALLGGAEEYAIECALLKVMGSEVVDYVVDEGVQIFGGNGFSADYVMDRSYRDARINRIFEGTNEINRLLGIDMILKRGLQGRINLMDPIQEIMGELTSIPKMGGSGDTGPLAKEAAAIRNFKKAILMVSGAAVQQLKEKLQHEQELIMNLADMGLQLYAAESAYLRAQKLILTKGEANVARQIDMVKVYVYDAAAHVNKAGTDAINSFAEGDMKRMLQMGLKRYSKATDINPKELRRNITAALLEANEYCY